MGRRDRDLPRPRRRLESVPAVPERPAAVRALGGGAVHLYLELWKPRPGWHALRKTERDLYLAGLGPAIAGLQAVGIELLGFARQEAGVAHAADFTWIAAWRMPTQELALRLERAVIDAGFHDLFEQVNARGEIVDPAVVLGEMGKA